MSIDERAAREIAERYHRTLKNYHRLTEIISEQIITRDYGWVFFVTTKELVETGDPKYRLYGGGGILVLKETGVCLEIGTSGTPIEDTLLELEADPEKFIYEHALEYREAKRLFISGKIMYEDWNDHEEAKKYFARSYTLRGEEMFQGEDPKYLLLLTGMES